jgi:hypothetical protein
MPTEMRKRPDTRATECFYVALRSLCGGSGTIQQRLGDAKMSLLTMHPSEIPEEIKEDFDRLMKEIDTPGGATPTVSAERARELALEILSMYTTLLGGL